MQRGARGRIRLFHAVYLRWGSAVVLALYSALLAALPVRDYYVSQHWQSRLNIDGVPGFSLWQWIAIGLGLAVAATFEGAYHEIEKYRAGDIDGTIEQLDSEVVIEWADAHSRETSALTVFRRLAPMLAVRGVSTDHWSMHAVGEMPFELEQRELIRCLEHWINLGIVQGSTRPVQDYRGPSTVDDYYLAPLGRQIAKRLKLNLQISAGSTEGSLSGSAS